MNDNIGTVEVCTDCYFAHHYGATRRERPATEREKTIREHPDTYRRELMGLEWVDDDTVAEWFAGDSDDACEGGEPLKHLPGHGHVRDGWKVTAITDFTCSNHFYGQDDTPDTWDGDTDDAPEPVCNQCGQTGWEDGITDFTWRSCDGCDSNLGGGRHRLAVHWEKTS